jgi:tRNA(fMet)-specific endonuclease VapC
MNYLLDTNVCIKYLNSDLRIQSRLLSLSSDCISTCEIVRFELYYGAFCSERVQGNLEILDVFFGQVRILPFDQAAARVCGEIRAQLRSSGKMIGPYDLQIAAIALVNDLVLVTHNVREFSRVEGLRWEDWEV